VGEPGNLFRRVAGGNETNAAASGEEALYKWIGSVLEAAAKDPKIKKTLLETAIAADSELITPYFRWNNIGRPAGNGWNATFNNAMWGTDYPNRTGAAKAEMFMNSPLETMYFNSDNDSQGQQLDGRSIYTVTFPKGQMPPGKGFWSLTLYNAEHFFTPNQLKRYSPGTKNKTLSTTRTARAHAVRRRQIARCGQGEQLATVAPRAVLALHSRLLARQGGQRWHLAAASHREEVSNRKQRMARIDRQKSGAWAVSGTAARHFTGEPTLHLQRSTIRRRSMTRTQLTVILFTLAALLHSAAAQEIPKPISTPDKVESTLGTLEYKDGAPSKETVAKAYDYLDLMHGVEAFVNAYQGASVAAIFKGGNDAGIPNNTALIFSDLMDAKSLFLTANADTIYFWINIDVSNGPIVVETPPLALGVVDDMWFQWITDFGLPGPDRGEGGKYLFLPPGYKGELPGGGYFVQKMRTTRATLLGRSFLDKNDPKPVVALIKKTLKVYPYLPGGYGTSIGSALQGKATLARSPDHKLDGHFCDPRSR